MALLINSESFQHGSSTEIRKRMTHCLYQHIAGDLAIFADISNAFCWMKMYEFRLRLIYVLKVPVNDIPALA